MTLLEWKFFDMYFDSNFIEISSHGSKISALVQVMVWRHAGNKPLPEPMMTQVTEA